MIRFIFMTGVCALGACVPVESDRILAKDVASANQAFANVDPAREVGSAPLAGLRRVFAADELSRLAKRFGVELSEPASEVCFERVAERLTIEKLLPVLESALAMERARIQIDDFSRYAIPAGTLEFPRTGLSANGFWRGRVTYGQGRSSPIWARIRVLDTVTGEPIALVPTRRAPVALGPKVVERGDTVRVEVSSGGVLLAFEAAAETAGRTGDTVLVKNRDNGRRFQATVEDKGKVVIRK
jgi:hypothetical protein